MTASFISGLVSDIISDPEVEASSSSSKVWIVVLVVVGIAAVLGAMRYLRSRRKP